MSKGSKRRPEDIAKVSSNWDRIFNNTKTNAPGEKNLNPEQTPTRGKGKSA